MTDKARRAMNGVSFALALLLAGAMAFAGVWDAVALFLGGRENTISSIVVDWSHQVPLIPFAAGMLAGHLFFPMRIP